MQRKINVINLYSDINEQINFIIVVENEIQVEVAEQIIEEAFSNWFDLENYPELQCIPIGDYIREELNNKGIKYEWYVKQED